MTAAARQPISIPTGSGRWGLVSRLRPFVSLLRPHRRLLAAAVISGILNQFFNISSAVLAAYLVGSAIEGASTSELMPGIVLLVLLVAPRLLFPALDSFLSHVMAFRTLVDMRELVYSAFERLAPAYLVDRRSGDLGAAVISDVEAMEGFFAHTLSPLVVAAIVPLTATLVLAVFHPLLAIVLLPFLILVASVPAWLRGRAERQGNAYRQRMGELNAEIVDSVQGLREVVAFGYGTQERQQLAAHSRLLQRARAEHGRRAGYERAATDTLIVLGFLAVVVVAGLLVVDGQLSEQLYPASVVLAAFTFAPVASIADVARDLNVVAAAGERIVRVIHAVPAVEDRPSAGSLHVERPVVRFADVRFRYAADLPLALDGVSFDIQPHETVALVGHSGAGKTTCANLLLRFWDPEAGALLIDGHDLRDVTQASLRRLITLVPQDVYLFAMSVRDNIRLARPDASDAEVEAAARIAVAHEFIVDELPDGYDTQVGERGAQLSGGQRQRIAIARAVLKDAPILVMDEAVSSLDTESERALQAGLTSLRRGRTTLIIAHRLSTIRTADRIVVLDHGRVVESGTHADLLARAGAYAGLVAPQATGRGRTAEELAIRA